MPSESNFEGRETDVQAKVPTGFLESTANDDGSGGFSDSIPTARLACLTARTTLPEP